MAVSLSIIGGWKERERERARLMDSIPKEEKKGNYGGQG